MPGFLDLDTPTRILTPVEVQKASTVKTIGVIALILAVLGIFVPFILDIAAFILAKVAMKISRDNLVPIEYEKPAYWAYRVSLVGIILWVVVAIRVMS